MLTRLNPGDGAKVDEAYKRALYDLGRAWTQKHGDAANNRHTGATWRFVEKDTDPEFREGDDFGWVRNTVVSLDTDLADMAISERAGFYFPQSPSTAGVLLPNGVMKFIKVGPGGMMSSDGSEAASESSEDAPMTAQGDTTMGMLIDTIYAGDWTDEVENFLEE